MSHLSRLFLLATLLFAGLVSFPQEVSIGSITGLGIGSALVCCMALMCWTAKPQLARHHIPLLFPLFSFAIFAAGSMVWFSASVKGLQLMCVLVGFVALILLTIRAVEDDPSLAGQLHRAADIAAWFATGVYAISILLDGLGADSIILARPFALFALVGVARQVAIWQAGNWRGLLGAAVITAVIFGSISRTALAAAVVMVPLAALVKGDRKSIAFAGAVTLIGGLALAAGVMVSETMYERFFGLDASMQVGGVAVNASGRTAMWALLWEDAWKAPILGHGLGSSALLIDQFFPGLGHPHNDFLRIFYDFGGVGFVLWGIFHVSAIGVLFFRARRSARANSPDAPFHLVPLLLLVVLTLAMFTDNPISYLFVMAPLGILLGCSLGRPVDVQPRKERPASRARRWINPRGPRRVKPAQALNAPGAAR